MSVSDTTNFGMAICGVYCVKRIGRRLKKESTQNPVLQGMNEECTFLRENPQFLTEQIITYLGNKRALLGFIGQGVQQVASRLGHRKLRVWDAFSGSGVVARYLKQWAAELFVNDLEEYSRVLNECYLSNTSELDAELLQQSIRRVRETALADMRPGLLAELYAPQEDSCIRPGERVFFTRRNACYIDSARRAIDKLPPPMQVYALAPLLYESSVHNNTSGVFKGFYKDARGIGQFGGQGRNALERILRDIELPNPIFSRFECPFHVMQMEARAAVRVLPELDLAYLDPPYNQHPYGSNYFMLNMIVRNERPVSISPVSGIPADWNRSLYNKRAFAAQELFALVEECPARFVLISYNSEGFVPLDVFVDTLQRIGKLSVLEQEYNTFRACRNLRNRNIKVREYLFLLEK